MAAWQTVPSSQTSDNTVQRFGFNRRMSVQQTQRLPPSVINKNILPIPDDPLNKEYPQSLQFKQHSNTASPERPLFKSMWGFDGLGNSEVPISPTSSNNPTFHSPNLQSSRNRIHSIAEIPDLAINQQSLPPSSSVRLDKSLSVSPNRGPTYANEANMLTPSTDPNDQLNQFTLTSRGLRSSSFAVPKSKLNMYFPTTSQNEKVDQFQQQQAQQQYKQANSQYALPYVRKQQLPHQSQHLQQTDTYRRLSQQYDPRLQHFMNNRSKNVLESQQQQIIPPLRADGPVPHYIHMETTNNNNFNTLRRGSVAAVYHQQQQQHQQEPHSAGNQQMVSPNMNLLWDLNQSGAPSSQFLDDSYNISDSQISRFDSQYVYQPQLKTPKFTPVMSAKDLEPIINEKPKFRRVSTSQKFVSPLKALTTDLSLSYSMCVPEYNYQTSKNPRRVLTKNNKPYHNNGYDNENHDYILHVNDILGTEENKKYLVLDILGQGTFGQVVKCQNLKTQEIVAVKVVKAIQECLQQSMVEGNILEFLTKRVDPKYEKYFCTLKDKFMHRYHLCLVFELLSSNLYELIKQNHHHGLNIKLVRNFSVQILESLCALKDIKLIHCDLKPENILLTSLNKPDLKIIDFGGACQERHTVYTYVQSRFYRSPEVILGVEYSTSVDMWSFGCIVAELFLGLPLFPGASEYEQLVRIVDTFGMPPFWMMVEKKSNNYIVKTPNSTGDGNGKFNYRLKTLSEFNHEYNLHESTPKQYFSDTRLDDIIMKYRLPRKDMTEEMVNKEMHERSCLVHFLKGVLNISPLERWTPHEAIHHPFITGEEWTGSWSPPTAKYSSNAKHVRSNSLV